MLNEDQARIIELCKTENLRVNAVAGSGKTTTLASAYLSIVAEMLAHGATVSEAVNRILVLTFTNDAAYDLKKKIYELLYERYSFTDSLTFVSTIHSFSNLLFNDLIIRLNINPDYSIDEDYELEALKDRAFQNVLLKSRPRTKLINEYFNIDRSSNDHNFQHLLSTLYAKTRQFGWDAEQVRAKLVNPALLSRLNLDPDSMHVLERLLNAIKAMLIDYINELDSLKFETGLFEFEDLLFYPYLVLKSDPSYRQKWSSKFQYILIDEYQDTSILQFEFIRLLMSQNRTSLFGDYYQSIYEWRDASPEYMINLPEFKTVSMRKNYRSGAEIIRFINALFSSIFADSHMPFTSMEPQSPEDSKVYIFEALDTTVDAKIEAEAQNFALMIRYLNSEKHVEYRDMTMLFRAKTHVQSYVKALQQHGIEYVLVTNTDFFKLEEIQFMLNFLFFLGSKTAQEQYYYFALLIKAPVYGGDDVLLWHVAQHDHDINAYSEHESVNRFRAHVLQLRRYMVKKKDLLLLKLLELTNLDLYYLGLANGYQKYANIRKFIDMVRSIEQPRIMDYAEFMDALRELIRGEREGEAIVNDKEDNAVKIMTVHANKGLQAKAVFLPALFTKPRSSAEEFMIDRELGFMLNLEILNEDYKDMLRSILPHDSGNEEYLRLLYVAMTRAENYLLFSVERNNARQGTWSKVVHSHLAAPELDRYLQESSMLLESIHMEPGEQQNHVSLTMRTVPAQSPKLGMLSPTMFNLYQQCPRKYYYVSRLGSSGTSEREKLGRKMHELLRTGAVDEEDALLTRMVTKVYSSPFWSEVSLSKNYRELGFMINIEGTLMRGAIDLVYEHEGWNIIDYKTGSTDMALYRGQLLCYALAFYYLKSERARKIGLYSIRENRLVWEYAPAIEAIELQVRDAIRDIEAGKFPKTSTESCSSCEFSKLCKSDIQ